MSGGPGNRSQGFLHSLFSSKPCPNFYPHRPVTQPVCGVMAFPVPAGTSPSCAFTESPLNWRDLRMRPEDPINTSCIQSFQLAIALIQLHTLGTPSLKPQAIAEISDYKEIHELMFNKKYPHLPIESNFLTPMVAWKGTTRYDPTVADKIYTLYRNVQGREMEIRNLMDRHAAYYGDLNSAPLLQEDPNDAGDDDSQQNDNGPERDSSFDELSRLLQRAASVHSRTAAVTSQQRIPGAPSNNFQSNIHETDDGMLNKLSLYVVRLHERNRPQYCSGAILYVLVHDPNWNPGQGVDELLYALRVIGPSGQASTAATRRDRRILDQVAYDYLETSHILRLLNDEMYQIMCCNYMGAPMSYLSPTSYANEHHAFHPFNVFTPARALEVIRKANPAIDLRQILDWDPLDYDPHQRLRQSQLPTRFPLLHRVCPLFPHLFPAEPAAAKLPIEHTYELPHQQVAWVHATRVGLYHQFLPWETGHISIEMHDPETDLPVLITTGSSPNMSAADSAHAQLAQTFLANRVQSGRSRHVRVTRDQLNWAWAAEKRYQPLRMAATNLQPKPPSLPYDRRSITTSNNMTIIADDLKRWLLRHNRYADELGSLESQLTDIFAGRIWTTDAKHPDGILAVIEWQLTGKVEDGQPGERPGFETIPFRTPFLNRNRSLLSSKLEQFGYLLCNEANVANNICEAACLILGVLDAYNHNPGISVNNLHSGTPGSGKSFLGETLESVMIPRTVTRLSSQSKRSDNVFADFQGSIKVMDEAQAELLVNRPGGGGDGGARSSEFKAASVGGIIVHVVPNHNAEGVLDRSGQLVVITWHGRTSFTIAMNNKVTDMEPAVVSRFVNHPHMDYDSGSLLRVTSSNRTTTSNDHDDVHDGGGNGVSGGGGSGGGATSILQKNLGENNHFENNLRAKQHYHHWIEQALLVMVNKAIQCGVLPDVDLTLCRYATFHMLCYFQEHGGISITNFRRVERVCNMARVLTILNAIHLAFANPYDHAREHDHPASSSSTTSGNINNNDRGRQREGDEEEKEEPFRVRDITRVKPFLTCTLDTAVFAFSLLAVQWLNPLETHVLRHALEMLEFPLVDQHHFVSSTAPPTGGDGIRSNYPTFALHWFHSGATSVARRIWKRTKDTTTNSFMVDLNYIEFSGTLSALASALQARMHPKPSREDIESTLRELTSRVVRLPRHPLVSEEALAANATPECPSDKMPVVVVVHGTSPMVYIAPAAFEFFGNETLLPRAVQSLAYKGLKPRTFLLGTMANPATGEFAEVKITEEQCAAGPSAFAVPSANYLPHYTKMAAYGERIVTPEKMSSLFPDMGEDDEGTVEEEVDEARQQAEETHFEKLFMKEIDSRLHQNRQKKMVRIFDDLDEWAVQQHFIKSGIPLCMREGDRSDLTLYWKYTAKDGTILRRPLPTPEAMRIEAVRRIQSSRPARLRYNLLYRDASPETKAQLCIPARSSRHPCTPPTTDVLRPAMNPSSSSVSALRQSNPDLIPSPFPSPSPPYHPQPLRQANVMPSVSPPSQYLMSTHQRVPERTTTPSDRLLVIPSLETHHYPSPSSSQQQQQPPRAAITTPTRRRTHDMAFVITNSRPASPSISSGDEEHDDIPQRPRKRRALASPSRTPTRTPPHTPPRAAAASSTILNHPTPTTGGASRWTHYTADVIQARAQQQQQHAQRQTNSQPSSPPRSQDPPSSQDEPIVLD